MASSIQHSDRVRINAKGVITVPFYGVFNKAHPDEVWDIICKKARTVRHSRNKGVKLYV